MTQIVDINSELYIPLLTALRCKVDEDGAVHQQMSDNYIPAVCVKKQLILPTQHNLQHAKADQVIFFHPMSENYARGDSDVYNWCRYRLVHVVNNLVASAALMLLDIANSHGDSGTLNSKQLALVNHLDAVDEKTFNNFTKTLKGITKVMHGFYTVYNKRSGEYKGQTYNRVAVARFPLIEELSGDIKDSEFWSAAKLRKADIKNYQGLFDYLLPKWDVVDHYSTPSDETHAPNLHALMLAAVKIFDRINKVAITFKKYISHGGDDNLYDYLHTDNLDELTAVIENLGRFDNLVPVLEGNAGEISGQQATTSNINRQPKGVPPKPVDLGMHNPVSEAAPTPTPPANPPAWQNTQPTPPQYQAPVQQPPQPQQQQFIGFPNQQPQYQQPPQIQQGGFIGLPNQQQYQQAPPPQPNDALSAWNQEMAQHQFTQQQQMMQQQPQYQPQQWGGQQYQQQQPQYIGMPQQQQWQGQPNPYQQPQYQQPQYQNPQQQYMQPGRRTFGTVG